MEKILSANVTHFTKRSLAIAAIFAIALTALADQRVHLVPKLTSGETFRYQIETTTSTSSKTTTPIVDPGGATQTSQSISLLVRLDVLQADPAAQNGLPGAIRLRATYEKSKATSKADAYDPAAPSPDDSYNRLEGHSIEFTIEPGGAVTDFKGLVDIFSNRSDADPMLSWAKGLSSGASAPGKGIVIGQKWNSERPFAGTPFSDSIWRSDSTYLRNEPCDLPAAAGESAAANPSAGANSSSVATAAGAKSSRSKSPDPSEGCAVILTSFKILRHGSAHSDATPPDYVRNGLHTSGAWQASGENLDSISLSTGLIVRSTQTSTQDADYEITSVSVGSSIHQVSHTITHSEIRLVRDALPIGSRAP
jgi:hypothetical protein